MKTAENNYKKKTNSENRKVITKTELLILERRQMLSESTADSLKIRNINRKILATRE